MAKNNSFKDDARVLNLSKKAKINFILQSGYRNDSLDKHATEVELMSFTNRVLVTNFHSIILDKSKESTSQSFRGNGSEDVTLAL